MFHRNYVKFLRQFSELKKIVNVNVCIVDINFSQAEGYIYTDAVEE